MRTLSEGSLILHVVTLMLATIAWSTFLLPVDAFCSSSICSCRYSFKKQQQQVRRRRSFSIHNAFQPTHTKRPTREKNLLSSSKVRRKSRTASSSSQLRLQMDDDNKSSIPCSSPWLTTATAVVAGLGVLDTVYLTWSKLTNTAVLCGTALSDNPGGAETGGCASVLNGPFSVIPGTDIPLAAAGLVAFGTVTILALTSATTSSGKHTQGRISVALTSVTTAMAVFSIFLMTLLFGVLKATCLFCVTSACLSLTLAMLSWWNLSDENIKQGVKFSTVSGFASFGAALFLYLGAGATNVNESASSVVGEQSSSSSSLSSGVLVAKAEESAATEKKQKLFAPPGITAQSTNRALKLSKELQALNARMYGAYWCSHCFDQKERLGKEAFQKIQYIECSKDGINSQTTLCKEEKIPGYPTWQIDGQLYPGEQELDELEEIVQRISTE